MMERSGGSVGRRRETLALRVPGLPALAATLSTASVVARSCLSTLVEEVVCLGMWAIKLPPPSRS